MTLRQKIRITLAMFASSAVLIIAGIWGKSVAMGSGGGFLFFASILTALICWRCPNCGKGFDPPFKKKNCKRCGLEIDYEARGRKF